MSSQFPNSTSGGITPERKKLTSTPKPKGGAINITEPKAKKGGSMSIKVNVEKIVIGDPKMAGLYRPGSARYRSQGGK